jgi:putative spermidine/putrescine transport system ATP-binding protein
VAVEPSRWVVENVAERPPIQHQKVTGSRPLGASIAITHLTKRYGAVEAVKDVNLAIAAGELVTFLGPSGSGKSTILSMIAGFTVPSDGDIRIGDQTIVSQPPHKRNIGMVFQDYALFPHMDVFGNVAFPLEMRGVAKASVRTQVLYALNLVRLDGLESRKPRQLSGGQRQRVALARALVFNPSVLLLDEPLGALDAKLREQMKLELKQLHATIGSTIVFVTHDQEEALTLSDRIALFDQGRMVQFGKPAELYRAPVNRFVAEFIGETNLLGGEVTNVSSGTITIRVGQSIEVVGLHRPGFASPKKRAVFTLRLENIALGPSAAIMCNRFQGRVEQLLYVGSAIKYLVRLDDEVVLTLRQSDTMAAHRMEIGELVMVGWRESDMLLVETDK